MTEQERIIETLAFSGQDTTNALLEELRNSDEQTIINGLNLGNPVTVLATLEELDSIHGSDFSTKLAIILPRYEDEIYEMMGNYEYSDIDSNEDEDYGDEEDENSLNKEDEEYLNEKETKLLKLIEKADSEEALVFLLDEYISKFGFTVELDKLFLDFVYKGDVNMVESFIKSGADVNYQDTGSDIENAMVAAVYSPDPVSMVNLLYQNDFEVEELAGPALLIAAEKGYIELIDNLAENGAEINYSKEEQISYPGQETLFLRDGVVARAAEFYQLDTLRYLLNNYPKSLYDQIGDTLKREDLGREIKEYLRFKQQELEELLAKGVKRRQELMKRQTEASRRFMQEDEEYGLYSHPECSNDTTVILQTNLSEIPASRLVKHGKNCFDVEELFDENGVLQLKEDPYDRSEWDYSFFKEAKDKWIDLQ